MDSQILAVVSIVVLGLTGFACFLAAILPQRWRWPWVQYRTNLRWYRSSKKHLLYVIGGDTPAPAVVIHGFNYWTGRVRMRHLTATQGSVVVKDYHANEIVPVVFRNTMASGSTTVE